MKNNKYSTPFIINLSSDAGDGANTVAVNASLIPTPELDPLSTPVGDIDLSRPLAPASNYEMSVAEATVGPNKAQTGRNLNVKLKSTKEIRSTKGDVMAPGALVLSKYYPLQATDKMSLKQVAQGIARLAKGLGLPASLTATDIINNPSILAGKIGLFKVAVKQETAEYPEGNEVKDIVIEG